MSEKISFIKEYKAWAKVHNQHGKFAMSRFVMLKYLEAVQSASNDFVFKGGNLLWHYIKTPRATVDLDLSTIAIKSSEKVKELLEKTQDHFGNISFSILRFKSVETIEGGGASVTIGFKTDSGQKNQFEIDIVYVLTHELERIKSTVSSNDLQSVSLEDIICDKVSASHRFGGGNTRMKDFDDLWRIAKSDKEVNAKSLIKISDQKSIKLHLDSSWINKDMQKYWQSHRRSYADLPNSLEALFDDVNSWLESLLR